MKNPFKFGTIVEDEFFTDRKEDLQYICRVMDSENHLALISPRRFGKSSLVLKAAKQLKRPHAQHAGHHQHQRPVKQNVGSHFEALPDEKHQGLAA